MKAKRFMLAALVLGVASTMARADLHEVKENIKHDSKEAAAKTGHAARDFGHATASAAKAVGHGIAHASREGYEATKRATKRVFHKDGSNEKAQKGEA
ncbi:hypothetical protein [Paraburkholderia lycopersici]|uniref:Uncharacterized protein n=1 Tax=Paraburkholderia lycopersici TaxID=416944 RepID=A0A1G6M6U1_9BURK|nr:hypothetical protein [Paraburkholderia lycopersici]SDC50665.1 hypothetical protein SAMN05421548_107133 [Paraburkholderia lycopersici]